MELAESEIRLYLRLLAEAASEPPVIGANSHQRANIP